MEKLLAPERGITAGLWIVKNTSRRRKRYWLPIGACFHGNRNRAFLAKIPSANGDFGPLMAIRMS
jgi:hypothetical protein